MCTYIYIQSKMVIGLGFSQKMLITLNHLLAFSTTIYIYNIFIVKKHVNKKTENF